MGGIFPDFDTILLRIGRPRRHALFLDISDSLDGTLSCSLPLPGTYWSKISLA